MKKVFFLFIFLGMPILTWAASANVPTVDFGTIYFCPDGSGSNRIAIDPDSGNPTPSGSGNITNQSGGAAGSSTVSRSGFVEYFQTIYFFTKKSASSTLNGCGGTVTITNATTKGGNESASVGMLQTAQFPVGADIIVSSFSGITSVDAPCTLSGTVSGLLSYSAGNSNPDRATPLNLSITAQIVPVAKLAHHDGSALDFGQICLSSQTQTITVSPAGAVTSSNLRCADLGNTSADEFNIIAPIGLVYNVEVPNSAEITNGIDSLTVTGFTPSCTSCTMASTSATLNVGGTLTIPANVSTGDYTGAYQVRITY